MKNILQNNILLITVIMGVTLLFVGLVFEPALANHTPEHTACEAIDSLNSGANCATAGDGSSVKGIATDVINILSWLIGVLSVIMVIIGGFRYITSGGDAGKTVAARNTIIYALVGLVIAIFAQAIVAFVLVETTTAAGYLDILNLR